MAEVKMPTHVHDVGAPLAEPLTEQELKAIEESLKSADYVKDRFPAYTVDHLIATIRARDAAAEKLERFVADVSGDMECLPECNPDVHSELCPVGDPLMAWRQLRAQVAAAEKLQARIDQFWFMVRNCFDIEPREFFEENAEKSGDWSPEGMAVHYIWKREPKVAAAEKLLEAAREVRHKPTIVNREALDQAIRNYVEQSK